VIRNSWIVNRRGSEQPFLLEQLPQILEHFVFFVRERAIGEKELLAQSIACPFTAAVPSLSFIEARN